MQPAATQRVALELDEEEAYALLGLCMTSPCRLDADSERALRKLAEYCLSHSNNQKARVFNLIPTDELDRALKGAEA